MDAKQIISQNLVNLLNQNNMSKSELATRLGVSKTSVSNWCLGLLAPRMDKIDAMASIFGVNRSAFYEESASKIVISEENSKLNHILQNAIRLDDNGLDRLMGYSDDLIDTGKYFKTDADEEQKPPQCNEHQGG